MCLNGIGIFLGNNDNSSQTYFRHLDHVVQLVGADHVGIGLDYVFDLQELGDAVSSMEGTFPEGLGYEVGANLKCVSAAQIAEVVELQLKAGYEENDIRKILDENLRRIAKAIWKPVSREYGPQ